MNSSFVDQRDTVAELEITFSGSILHIGRLILLLSGHCGWISQNATQLQESSLTKAVIFN